MILKYHDFQNFIRILLKSNNTYTHTNMTGNSGFGSVLHLTENIPTYHFQLYLRIVLFISGTRSSLWPLSLPSAKCTI